jgi:phage gp36-like protein
MEAHFLRETLKLGTYRLCDEEATLKERAKTKDRVKWLREQHGVTNEAT